MRQFFKFVFATFFGLILFIVVSFFVLIIWVGAATKDKPATVKPNSVLTLDLNYQIPEKTNDNPFSSLSIGNTTPKKAIGLFELRQAIKKAAKDDNIKGIYMKMGLGDNGYATMESIREALTEFKKAGKFVYAYGEVYSQKSYYLASVADKIFLNPNGGIELKGFGREIMYYKNMFEKIGVEVQDFHCGAFKSAIEPFIRNDMSPANREQLMNLYGDVYSHFLTVIGSDRKIDTAQLASIVNNLSAESPEKCKELHLVDEVAYYDQVESEMKKKVGIDDKKDLEQITLGKYVTTIEKDLQADNKIAVVVAEGEIVDGESSDGKVGGQTIAERIAKLRKDDKVKAIVLRVNSPGGSALASDVMWRELVLAKKAKPLIISFGDVAASGGYYIACMGDRIFAQPNTITGSIGVFGLIPNAKKMLNEKLGITTDEVEVTKHGVLGGITKPLDAEESAVAQRNVERTYREFKSRVAEGRGKDTAYIETIAQGHVWTGTQGIKIGLVDEIGGLDEAIAYAAKKANVKDYRVKLYPEEKTLGEQLREAFGDAKSDAIKEELGDDYEMYKTIKYLRQTRGTQMRMVYDLGL
ncbi:MAG: signal peptide peptidase SppA [Chitinophagales bacterium]